VTRFGYDERSAALLVFPVLAVLLVVAAFPIIYSFWVSLHDIVLTRPLRRPFVGFDNYLRIFDDARFWTAVVRTTVYTLVCVVVTTFLAVLVALLLNEVFPGQRLLSALLLVPWATPSVVNGLMWKWIYDPTYGLLNGLLVQVGLLERYRVWLGDPDITLLLIANAAIWKQMPLAALLMIVTMIESTGMFMALGDIVGRRIDDRALASGLRVDGLGTVIGGLFNTFPYTSFSQNVGLVGVTGIRSRFVCVAAGVILIAFGLFPKMAHVAASIPQFVLGGAGIVMFGMVAATGIKILSKVDFHGNRNNLFIVAISIGVGMIPIVAPTFFDKMPHLLGTIFHSGILLASAMAVGLNLFFNGRGSEEDVARYAVAAAQSSDH
jgi:hypothetical protein